MKILFFVSIYCFTSVSFAQWNLVDTDLWKETGGFKFIRVVPSNESNALDIYADLNESDAVDIEDELSQAETLDLQTVNGHNESEAVDIDKEFNEPDTLDLHTVNGHNESDAADIEEELNESETLDLHTVNGHNESDAVDIDEEFNESDTMDLHTVNGHNESDAVDIDEELNSILPQYLREELSEVETLDLHTVNGHNESDAVDIDEEFNELDTTDLHTLNSHNESDPVDIGEEFNDADLLNLLILNGHNSCPCASAINDRRFPTRIVGGRQVPDDISFPYQAMFLASGYACGATILNRRHLLTAMHCLSTRDGEEHSTNSSLVFIGSNYLSRRTGDVLKVTRFIKHPDFNNRTLENDIAIIEVDEDIKFDNSVAAACLPSSWEEDYVGRDAIVTGWGATIGYESEQPEEQDFPKSLKQTEVTVLNSSDSNCARDSLDDAVTKMCAYKNGTDACQGDSGGPLTVEEGGVHVLIGVVSYGFGCAAEDRPGIYTRVNNYLRWIVDNTQDGRC